MRVIFENLATPACNLDTSVNISENYWQYLQSSWEKYKTRWWFYSKVLVKLASSTIRTPEFDALPYFCWLALTTVVESNKMSITIAENGLFIWQTDYYNITKPLDIPIYTHGCTRREREE